MKTRYWIPLLVLLCVLPTGLFGAAVDSRISAVTVYSDRAIITRTTDADLAVGEHSLIFENLPAALIDQSLQASGRGTAKTTILDVTAKNVFAETTSNERVKALEDQIKVLQKERRTLDDRFKILEEERGWVERMLQSAMNPTPTTPAAGAATRTTLTEWQSLFTYSRESLARISNDQQLIDVQREDLEAKRNAIERQLNELRGARGRQSKTVTVRVAVSAPGRLDVAVRYAIPNAGWTPSYDARLRSADRAVDLSYFGIVRNGTGEDWKDVALTLSTARPNVGGAAPELRPWIADTVKVPVVTSASAGFGRQMLSTTDLTPDVIDQLRLALAPVDAELGRGNSQVQIATRGGAGGGAFGAARAIPPPPPPPLVMDAGVLSAAVETSVTSATFKIPVAVNIPGNSVSQKVAINETRLQATLQFQSTPKLIEAAFLIANATNTGDYPLLAGPMNTFLDDTFVAASSLKAVMPGEKFDLALGVDDGISVKRRLVNRFTEDTGLTNKSRRVTYEVLLTLTNNKTTAEKVVFKEPTPVARDEKITVKLLTPQEKELGTTASPKEISKEEDGKLVWRLTLKPGEKREFSLKLSVEHPADVAVTGLE